MQLIKPQQKNKSYSQNIRLAKQIQDLDNLDPLLTYRISIRHNRTLIYLNINQHQIAEEESFFVIHPEQLIDQQERMSMDCSINNISHYDLVRQTTTQVIDVQQSCRKICENNKVNSPFMMILIIDHQLYPFEPPLLILSSIFPPLCDFKDYLYDALKIQHWWPLCTLEEIVKQLPFFAQQLRKNMQMGSLQIGSYSLDHPICLADVKEFAQGLLIVEGKAKFPHQAFIAFFMKTHIGLSFTHVICFKEKYHQVLMIDKLWPVSQLTNISIREGKKHLQVAMDWPSDHVVIKMPYEKLGSQGFDKTKLFISYYQLIIAKKQRNKEESKSICLYGRISELGTKLGFQGVRQWVRKETAIMMGNNQKEED